MLLLLLLLLPWFHHEIQHIKWQPDRLLQKIDFYFVHSYYASISINTIATGNYILPFSAAMQQNNFFATQFHPEKSGSTGVKLLQNFLTIC